ncbi:MAG: type II toxin-antitoxin system VapC family toxin [Alphaproteobacteria bacterium]|nr:type II toxin-antitoxin system VapC family toxin [Alphaproteobacteria bacterium]
MKLGNNTRLKNLRKDQLSQTSILFWDTSLPVQAIFHHKDSIGRKAAIDFIDRIIKEKIYVAFSSVLFDEFIYVATRNELIKSQFTKNQVKKVLERKDEKIIAPHIKDIQKNMAALNEILSRLNKNFKVIFPCEPGIIAKALELQCEYKLERADSIHIATMLYGSQKDIACFDRKDFGRVDGLNIWCRYN